MTDLLPEVEPFASVPTRPVQDGIIDPVWGQWVHDELVDRGLKARAEVTTGQTIPATPTDITGLTVTWTAKAGRWYRCAFQIMVTPGGSGGTCLAYLQDVTGGAQLHGVQGYQAAAGNGLTLTGVVLKQFPAGTRTLKVQAQTQGANGGTAVAPTFPLQLVVEDVGPV